MWGTSCLFTLKHQIDPKRDGKSYIINKPSMEKYESFANPYPIEGLRIHKEDLRIVRKIQKKMRSTNRH